jgi:hypothetical protein
MAQITVHRPDAQARPAAAVEYATRRKVPEGAVLTLIENGKPHARDLMRFVAAELEQRVPIARVDVFSKPSAAKPIDADEAKALAARSHLVITGVGD